MAGVGDFLRFSLLMRSGATHTVSSLALPLQQKESAARAQP